MSYSSLAQTSYLSENLLKRIPDSQLLDSLILSVNKSSTQENKINAYAALVAYHEENGDYENALIYLDKACDLADKENIKELEIALMIDFPYTYLFTSKFSTAILRHERILQKYKGEIEQYDLYLFYSRLGYFNESLGRVYVATSHYFTALKIAESLNDLENIAKMCNNIGNAYLGIQQPNEAKTYITKGIEIMENQDDFIIPILYNNLAKVYESLGDTNQALVNYNLCISAANIAEIPDAIITSGINLSHIWTGWENIDSASYYASVVHEQALKFDENSPQLVRSLVLQANICEYQKDNACWEDKLLSAYQKALASGLMLELEVIAEELTEYYHHINKNDEAYFYLQEKIKYSDSINIQEAQNLLYSKKEEKNLDSLRFESYKLETDKEVLELQVSNRTFGLVLAGSLLVSVVLISLLYYRNVKKNRLILQLEIKQKEDTIVSKNREILSANLEIEAQEQALGQIKNKLSQQLSAEYDAEFNELNVVLRQTDRSLSKLERRRYIDNLIKLTDNEFHNILKKNFETLTSGEIKLTTLIRLNLGTEELLDIFNISRESLNKKRYRLRKKFNLDKEQDLDQFIRSIHSDKEFK
jgi:hypothetical protein